MFHVEHLPNFWSRPVAVLQRPSNLRIPKSKIRDATVFDPEAQTRRELVEVNPKEELKVEELKVTRAINGSRGSQDRCPECGMAMGERMKDE